MQCVGRVSFVTKSDKCTDESTDDAAQTAMLENTEAASLACPLPTDL